MAAGEILAWLAKTIGGEAIRSRLNRTGLNGELRILRKALEDSQNRRAELGEAARIVTALARQRDDYFAEIVRLRAENVALRDEIERLGGEGNKG